MQQAHITPYTSCRWAHAAIDALNVFPTELLPEDSPVWGLENAIISPHCSAVHDEWAVRSFEVFLDNLRGWRAGEPLQNAVDPARGD